MPHKISCIIRINRLYDPIFTNFLSFLCFHIIGCPRNHYFSNHSLLALQYEFNDIYDNQIAKKYGKNEMRRLSKRKNNGEIEGT